MSDRIQLLDKIEEKGDPGCEHEITKGTEFNREVDVTVCLAKTRQSGVFFP